MRHSVARRLFLAGLLVPCLPSLVGCTSQVEQEAVEQETSNLRMLAPFLGRYVASHRGQYPANEQEFRKFLEAQGKNPDELLVSTRDGKPIVIVYQGDRGEVKGNIVAYEQEGKDGTRMVVDDLGVTSHLTEEEFRKIVPAG